MQVEGTHLVVKDDSEAGGVCVDPVPGNDVRSGGGPASTVGGARDGNGQSGGDEREEGDDGGRMHG